MSRLTCRRRRWARRTSASRSTTDDAALVELAHGVDADAGRADELALAGVDRAQADQHHVARLELGAAAAEVDQLVGSP